MLIQKQVELHPHDLLKTDIYQAMGYRENVPDDTVCVLVDEVLTDISSFVLLCICIKYRKRGKYPINAYK